MLTYITNRLRVNSRWWVNAAAAGTSRIRDSVACAVFFFASSGRRCDDFFCRRCRCCCVHCCAWFGNFSTLSAGFFESPLFRVVLDALLQALWNKERACDMVSIVGAGCGWPDDFWLFVFIQVGGCTSSRQLEKWKSSQVWRYVGFYVQNTWKNVRPQGGHISRWNRGRTLAVFFFLQIFMKITHFNQRFLPSKYAF